MPNALIITAAGINCDLELSRAFELAGATPQSVHLNRLCADPSLVDRFDLIGVPGGFSFGDSIAAGRVMAQLMRQHLYDAFVRAIQRHVPIIAPCNGFQILVQMGLLPGPTGDDDWPTAPPTPTVALAENAGGRFIDRWTRVDFPPSRCVWTQNLDAPDSARLLPIAHGEGRFTTGDAAVLDAMRVEGRIAVTYAADDNPNGSEGDIAGICDRTGLVFGLMPHPERYTQWTQHPCWTRQDRALLAESTLGLAMFRNAVNHVRQVLAVS
jgi:phosphoribosylformylglycinamidine synthase I